MDDAIYKVGTTNSECFVKVYTFIHDLIIVYVNVMVRRGRLVRNLKGHKKRQSSLSTDRRNIRVIGNWSISVESKQNNWPKMGRLRTQEGSGLIRM